MTSDDEMLLLCKNIRFLRRYYKLSKKEMARQLHISVCSLRQIENNKIPYRLGANFLFYFFPIFGISLKQILSVDLSMPQNYVILSNGADPK